MIYWSDDQNKQKLDAEFATGAKRILYVSCDFDLLIKFPRLTIQVPTDSASQNVADIAHYCLLFTVMFIGIPLARCSYTSTLTVRIHLLAFDKTPHFSHYCQSKTLTDIAITLYNSSWSNHRWLWIVCF